MGDTRATRETRGTTLPARISRLLHPDRLISHKLPSRGLASFPLAGLLALPPIVPPAALADDAPVADAPVAPVAEAPVAEAAAPDAEDPVAVTDDSPVAED